MHERGFGLTRLGHFEDHDGFDGAMLGHPLQPGTLSSRTTVASAMLVTVHLFTTSQLRSAFANPERRIGQLPRPAASSLRSAQTVARRRARVTPV